MKNKFWKWLLGEQDEEPVVFEGTTADLLSSLPKPEEKMEEEKNTLEKQWLNLEFLKLALQIEESKSQKFVTYVDVGNLPKKKAEEYVAALKDNHADKKGDYWCPRREGGRGTEVCVLPGRVTLEDVLNTAATLKKFPE